MVEETVVKQWSDAFFLLALETKKMKQYSNEAGILIKLLKENPEFVEIISSTNLVFSTKKKIINETFASFLPYITNLMLLLSEKNYFQFIRLILKEFRKQCNIHEGIQYGTVYSVIELTDDQLAKIADRIKQIINIRDVELVNKIDLSLIGGIKVKIKNQVFDGSIKGRIEQLKNDLNKNKQE